MQSYNSKDERLAKEEDKHRKKAPSFQFYAQDFLTGTMDMSLKEKGIYITLLSYQWAKRVIPRSRVGIILNDSSLSYDKLPQIVKDKFIDYNGDFAISDDCIINQRLFNTMLQQILFYRKQRLNGNKGGRPKQPVNKPNKNPNTNPNKNTSIEVRSKKKEDEEEKVVYPYDDKTFIAIWDQWKLYKQLEHNFKFKSKRGEQLALSQLGNNTTDSIHAQKTIINSMANGWKGLFPDKPLKNESKKTTYSSGLKDEILSELQS